MSAATPFGGLAIREGHFLLESGLHTATWLDLDTLFVDPQALAPHIAALAGLISKHRISERAAMERFAVVDDVIGAGSAVRATVSELSTVGAPTLVVGALLTLRSTVISHLTQLGIPVEALSSREIAMWEPVACPQCQAGIPLHSVT